MLVSYRKEKSICMVESVLLKFVMMGWKWVYSQKVVVNDSWVWIEGPIKKRLSKVVVGWEFVLDTAYWHWKLSFLIALWFLCGTPFEDIQGKGIFLFQNLWLLASFWIFMRFSVDHQIVFIPFLINLKPSRIYHSYWLCQVSICFLIVKFREIQIRTIKVVDCPWKNVILRQVIEGSTSAIVYFH